MRLRLLAFVPLLLVACTTKPPVVTDIHEYLNRVEPIALGYTDAADRFEKAATQDEPKAAAFDEISNILEETVSRLQAIEIEDPEVLEAHRLLVEGHELLKQTIDIVKGALDDPSSVGTDFEARVTALADASTGKIDEWRLKVADLLPEEERAEFLAE